MSRSTCVTYSVLWNNNDGKLAKAKLYVQIANYKEFDLNPKQTLLFTAISLCKNVGDSELPSSFIWY